MLRIVDRELAANAAATLGELQAVIDREIDYPSRVLAAQLAWKAKASNATKSSTFRQIRATLAAMCVGPTRCAYCEDSLADEIEHIQPKTLFPQHVFDWSNYLLACGPCNGPKSNRYGYIIGDQLVEFVRKKKDLVVAPPASPPALLDPRREDPMDFLELDLGGVTSEGMVLDGTFEFLPNDDLSAGAMARASFTIDVLGLNREVIRASRANAFNGYLSRLARYVTAVEIGAQKAQLTLIRDDLLSTPHLTVFAEMRRQRERLPEIRDLFERAPQAAEWPLVVPGHAR